jgi:hypothetical protein
MADPSWEGVTERLIRQAQERGEFENLPHQGQPLPGRRNPYVGEMALAYDLLQDAGMAPPWIEADKDARTWLARRDALLAKAASSTPAMRRTLERELTQVVGRHNAAVDRVNAAAPTPRQHRSHLVVADELDTLHRTLDDRHRNG